MSMIDEFVGAWRLVSFEERTPGGEILHPYGERPVGLLVYDESGQMSVQVMRKDRAPLSSESFKDAAPDELRSALDGFTAFFGRYEINEDARVIIHHVEGHVLPNSVGKSLKRRFEFSGNRLVLMPAENKRVVWERINAQASKPSA